MDDAPGCPWTGRLSDKSKIDRNSYATHLLLALVKIEKHEFVVGETSLGKCEAYTISVGGASGAVECESWHDRSVVGFR